MEHSPVDSNSRNEAYRNHSPSMQHSYDRVVCYLSFQVKKLFFLLGQIPFIVGIREIEFVSLYYRYDLNLSFEESIFGVQREIEVSCFETCDNCNGTGARSSSSIQSCSTCGGRGGVMKTQKTAFGMMSQVTLTFQIEN